MCSNPSSVAPRQLPPRGKPCVYPLQPADKSKFEIKKSTIADVYWTEMEKNMAKRTDLKKILIIGSGPIVIGQAAEFD